jgi:hypothetical protein
MKFLVKWLEGYGDAKPEVVALDEIKESDAWDLTDDVIDNLSSLEVGHEYFHYELGSTLNFIKLGDPNEEAEEAEETLDPLLSTSEFCFNDEYPY